MTKSVVAFVSAGAILLACGSGSPPKVAMDPKPPAVPADPAAKETASTCLMVNVCSCNLGCATIQMPRSQIHEGTRTPVVSGPLAGQEVKVVVVVDTSGAHVLALTDLDHDHACSLPSSRALLGYGCEAKKSGPVPANACAHGCD